MSTDPPAPYTATQTASMVPFVPYGSHLEPRAVETSSGPPQHLRSTTHLMRLLHDLVCMPNGHQTHSGDLLGPKYCGLVVAMIGIGALVSSVAVSSPRSTFKAHGKCGLYATRYIGPGGG